MTKDKFEPIKKFCDRFGVTAEWFCGSCQISKNGVHVYTTSSELKARKRAIDLCMKGR